MSLTPAADDPNREKELKRAQEDPKEFDADPSIKHNIPKDHDTSTSGLVADRDKPAEVEKVAEYTVDAHWAEYLEQSVADIAGQLTDLDVDQLHALILAETAGKNRVTLITAVNEELAARGE